MIQKNRISKKGDSYFTSIFFYAFLAVLVLIIIVFLVNANFKINKKRENLLAQLNYLENELKILEEKKAQYELGIGRAETDEFWEEKLREQGYKKPGEGVFVIVPPEELGQEEIKTEKNLWQRLLEKLGF